MRFIQKKTLEKESTLAFNCGWNSGTIYCIVVGSTKFPIVYTRVGCKRVGYTRVGCKRVCYRMSKASLKKATGKTIGSWEE